MKVSQSFDDRFVRKFKLHQRIGLVLFKTPYLNSLLRKVSGMMLSALEDADRWRQRLDYSDVRKRGNANEHGYDKKYGDLVAALTYAKQVDQYEKGLHEHGEGKILYQQQLETMRRLIQSERPKRVLNFGVCFAYVDSILAKEFPDTEFVGIDLSAYNKAFNETAFPDVPNLKILAGDVFDELRDGEYRDCILFHSRTLVLLPSGFISELYAAAAAAGFKWVVGFEQNGLSEETLEPYVFDTTAKPSIVWRGGMYIHNYLGLVERAGFAVESADLFATGHASPDFKVLRFVARRTGT
jgi:hypothetical protein